MAIALTTLSLLVSLSENQTADASGQGELWSHPYTQVIVESFHHFPLQLQALQLVCFREIPNYEGAGEGPEFSIRGLAGPYVVVGTNFAPGTSGADIQSAMEAVGGAMQSCRIISSAPTVIAEMVFLDKSFADLVISTFNNKKVSQDAWSDDVAQ